MDRGQSFIIPHLFYSTNYAYWKEHMRVFFCSLWMKKYCSLSRLDRPNLLIRLHLRMMTRSKLRISTVERWMPCLVLWLTRSWRKYHLFLVPMKHGQFFKILMKAPKLWKNPSFKGLPLALKKSRCKYKCRVMEKLIETPNPKIVEWCAAACSACLGLN